MGKYISIAVDGVAGSGKSTISKLLATKLNYKYINTGIMYRIIAFLINLNGLQEDQIFKIIKEFQRDNIEYISEEEILYENENIYKTLRSPKISSLSSKIAKNMKIREFLVDEQRKMALNENVIMDGRDIGSVVLPDSKYKFFLIATPEIRANRRVKQNELIGIKENYDQILKDIIKRDYNDTNREISPLICVKNAIKIDTSNITIDETIKLMTSYIKM